jgi:ribosomal protein S27E
VSDNVVFLAFKNPEKTDEDGITFVACRHCRNKTYTLTHDSESGYPLVKCAGCGMHIGRVGWAE